MSIPRFTAHTDPKVLGRDLERTLKPVTDSLIVDGILIDGIVMPAVTDTTIYHKLGRTPRGCLLVQAPADIRFGAFGFTKETLTLRTNTALTISVWVF